ncbi:hypothetical protein BDZ97DRAFT_1754800 [Flammula alnicola]|nr:hypothetical protein BDZ97DRAFT_1754800 [Flammula alnicola]
MHASSLGDPGKGTQGNSSHPPQRWDWAKATRLSGHAVAAAGGTLKASRCGWPVVDRTCSDMSALVSGLAMHLRSRLDRRCRPNRWRWADEISETSLLQGTQTSSATHRQILGRYGLLGLSLRARQCARALENLYELVLAIGVWLGWNGDLLPYSSTVHKVGSSGANDPSSGP